MKPSRSPDRIFLRTKRLVLRSPSLEDSLILFDLDSDPEVMRHINGGSPTPLSVILENILPRWIQLGETDARFGYWIAELAENGEFAGWFHLRESRIEPGTMELGYRLRRKFWRQGLATEGARSLLGRAFGVYGLERVVATALEANAASRRVMEKLGLCFERAFQYPEFPGEPAVLYAVTAEAYAQRKE